MWEMNSLSCAWIALWTESNWSRITFMSCFMLSAIYFLFYEHSLCYNFCAINIFEKFAFSESSENQRKLNAQYVLNVYMLFKVCLDSQIWSLVLHTLVSISFGTRLTWIHFLAENLILDSRIRIRSGWCCICEFLMVKVSLVHQFGVLKGFWRNWQMCLEGADASVYHTLYSETIKCCRRVTWSNFPVMSDWHSR